MFCREYYSSLLVRIGLLRTLLFYYSISCVDGLRPQRPVHHILSCGELCSLLSILTANN
nr:MAG TPA: hypothetical protein [Caudoviricetes sp.]